MRTSEYKAEAELQNWTEHSRFLCYFQVVLKETAVKEELGDNFSEVIQLLSSSWGKETSTTPPAFQGTISDFPVLSNCFTMRRLSSDWELLHFNAKFQKDLSRCLLHLCFLFSLWFGSTLTQKSKKSGWADSLDFALEQLQTFFIDSNPPWRH